MALEIKALLDEEIAAYATQNPRLQAMFARAKPSLPGVHMAPLPRYADHGAGASLYDIDGHRLIDFANNNIVAALQKQIAQGTGA